GERGLERAAELAFDERAHLRKREGRHRVAEGGERLAGGGGERVVTQRRELSELGVRALQVPQGGRQKLSFASLACAAPLGAGARRAEGCGARFEGTRREDPSGAARHAYQGSPAERPAEVARRDALGPRGNDDFGGLGGDRNGGAARCVQRSSSRSRAARD